VCSVCSVVKKNRICFTLKDGTGNANVPRAALRFALGYLILPLWGGDITTLSCGDCPQFLAASFLRPVSCGQFLANGFLPMVTVGPDQHPMSAC
jgi:hypothetical protein